MKTTRSTNWDYEIWHRMMYGCASPKSKATQKKVMQRKKKAK